jgi:hypothetical protein
MHTLRTAIAIAALAFAGTAAHAQMVGTYAGTTSEGNGMSITIADDGSGGLVYTGNGFGWNMSCRTGDSKFGAWGVGAYMPFTGNKITVTNAFDFLYEKMTAKWSPDGQTVTGTFVGDEPLYVDITTSKKVEECTGSKITFTATLQAAGAARPMALPAGVHMRHVD